MVQWIERRPPEPKQINRKNKIKSRKTIINRAFTGLPFPTNLPEFASIYPSYGHYMDTESSLPT